MNKADIATAISRQIELAKRLGNPNIFFSISEGEILIATLEEQEAKTGHWISVDDGDIVRIDNDGFPERACFCSECKTYLTASDEYAVYGRYCPFCGAKMEGR